MSRRKKNTVQAAVPAAERKQSKSAKTGLIVSVLIALILGGIPFGLGKYIEFNSPGPFDSGAYVYSAKHLLEGAKMGVDELPSARPGTLIANIIGVKLFGFNDTGPKIIQMILQLAALIFMFITARKVFGTVASVISVTIAAIYLSAPIIAKFGNVKEQFMIAYMICAACAFLWYAATQKRYWLLLSGFFALQPYYFKPTGMSVVFGIILYILIGNAVWRKWKTLWTELAIFLCGYAAGMVIPGWLYTWQGIVPQLLKSFPPIAIGLGAGILVLTGIPLGVCILADKKDIGFIKKIPQWTWGAGLTLILVLVIITQWNRIIIATGLKNSGYIYHSLTAKGLSKVALQIFRYYKALTVPMLAGLVSVIVAIVVWLRALMKKIKPDDIQSKVVWALAVWWLLDVAFVWVSPRSYEQYYLPLCASGAMLGGYAVWKWQKQFMFSVNKMPWLLGGLAAAITLGCLSIPIFIGQRYSPDTGSPYQIKHPQTGEMIPIRRRGFSESVKRARRAKEIAYPWQQVGDYIKKNSDENDTIYVWGWFPGIYVQAQRMAPVSKASDGNMHVTPPEVLKQQINALVNTMKENPPKFIVDSRKQHFPNDRPPLELWPHQFSRKNPYGGGEPILNNPKSIAQYDALYKRLLTEKVDPRKKENFVLLATTGWPTLGRWEEEMPDEAQRYEAMKPFRDFVMQNYRIVKHYGAHVLFERK